MTTSSLKRQLQPLIKKLLTNYEKKSQYKSSYHRNTWLEKYQTSQFDMEVVS